jgi:hypothetical protein
MESKTRITRSVHRGPVPRYNQFTKYAVAAGLVPTLIKIVESTRQEQGILIALSHAWSTLSNIAAAGSLEDRRVLLDQLLDCSFFDVVLDVSFTRLSGLASYLNTHRKYSAIDTTFNGMQLSRRCVARSRKTSSQSG